MKTETLRNWVEQGGHSSPILHQVFSDCIKASQNQLIERFRQGTAAAELILDRSNFIDEILTLAWQHFLPTATDSLALLAVGGYGRQELHPYSDIDILVLRQSSDLDPILDDRISCFLSFIWDIGLKLAQSVRTLDECVSSARDDQTIMTNLLESRLVLGSSDLYDQLWEMISPKYLWSSNTFFEAKMAEQTARYAKYHDTAYNLEPNVKEGPGGLRDIQNMNWIIKRHYNIHVLNLVREGWLTEAEHLELVKARDFLWEIRFALHAMTGRCEDRLLFEYQKDLANQFGVEHQNPNHAVEQFMQLYYRTVMGLERLNELLMQLFQEVALQDEDHSLVIKPINGSFQSINGYLEVIHPDVFKEDPLALFRIFLLLQTQPELKGIRASTIRLIRQHLYLIDDLLRCDPEACRLFMEILSQKVGVTHELRRMNRYGVLAAYVPAFARVVGRMQYDLFHVYTVDEHTLFVVRNLRRFSLDEHRADHPLSREVFDFIEKPALLYVAALMHDIAKGSGGDHSAVGSSIAREFCQRHGMSPREVELVCWLVQNHLLMSLTAQRKDINDPEVIHAFATQVGDQSRLDHLYLLTVADIRATNPSLWNSWKDALLKELYLQTRWVFRRGLAKPLDQAEKLVSVKTESRALLHELGVSDVTIDRVWTSFLNDEYFQRYQPDEAAWHTIALGSVNPGELPIILLRPVSQRGSAEVFIYGPHQEFIFAHTTAVLDQLNLTIFDARIITTNEGYVLHSYNILEQTGEPIQDAMRQVQICVKLRECLSETTQTPFRVQRREARQIKHFTVPTQIYFHDDPQERYTILELIATDRPGLLSKVGRAFSLCGARLCNARISTIGSRAEDIFYLTGQDNQPLTNPAEIQELKDAIIGLAGTS